MKIKEFLGKDCIMVDLEKTDKEGHIREIVSILEKAGKVSSDKVEKIIERLMERERMGSTGIGEGVAIPHIKIEDVSSIIGALGISRKGVDFDSLDGEPVYISFLLLTPVEARNEHLKALSEISIFLKDRYYRQELRNSENSKHAYKLIKRV